MPWLLIHGSKEHQYVNDSCSDIAQRSPDLVEYHVLDGVYHAFDQTRIRQIRKVAGDNEALYSQAATDKSKSLIEAFLEKHFGEQ